MTFVFVCVLHIYRFFDRVFIKVAIPANSQSHKPIEMCRSTNAEWVQDIKSYEEMLMWGWIAVGNLKPLIVIVIFVALMARVLRKRIVSFFKRISTVQKQELIDVS